MEPEADRLMAETRGKNYIDQDEYPQTTEIQNRCVNILARLFNAPTDKPNLVMSSSVQVCWEKFARYFDVEPKYVLLREGRYVLDPEEAVAVVDENTIGVVGILGSTHTGEYEPIKKLNDALTVLNQRTGWDVPIHVDGASGAFVAPFLNPTCSGTSASPCCAPSTPRDTSRDWSTQASVG